MQSETRPRHSRTRSGCLTCRWRKKKCDEVKPRCAGCRRNQLVCEWPGTTSTTLGKPKARKAELAIRSSGSAMQCAVMQRPGHPHHSISMICGGPDRPCGLTPQSVLLLGHYLEQTVSYFAMRPLNDNPFVTLLLPLGNLDDLLMHGLLAFSGFHLTSKEPMNIELSGAARIHYSKLISGLRGEFERRCEEDLGTTERLLRVLMIACHCEAISGDTRGVMFSHLRASRYLILSLLTHKHMRQSWHTINMDALGFSIELYTYLLSCNAFIPYNSPDSHSPLNPFIITLEELQFYPTFGVVFAGAHELFQLIWEVSLLASSRLAEELSGVSEPSENIERVYNNLKHRLMTWSMPSPTNGDHNEEWENKRLAAEAVRQGLHIYLATSRAGSIVSDALVRQTIQGYVDGLCQYAVMVIASRHYVATLLWPVIVAGSCMVNPQEQHMLTKIMCAEWCNMLHLRALGELLNLVWKDPDPRAYGPYGLHLIMKKHGQIVGII